MRTTLLAVAAGLAALAMAGDAAAWTKWQCKVTGDLVGATSGHGHLTFTAASRVMLTAQNSALEMCLRRPGERPINPRTCKSEGCHQIAG